MIFARVEKHDGEYAFATVFDGNTGILHTSVVGQANFPQIVEKLTANPQDESVIPLFDVETAVSEAFRKVSAHITIANGEVLYDGDPLHNAITNHILRAIDEGQVDRLEALAAFTEKVMTNPQEHSRDQLFTWLDAFKFTITSEGNFVGYKGCANHDGVPVSSRPAPARDKVTITVDGETRSIVDYVPNLPGTVVEMPRSLVDFNAGVGCSVGLHVGTYAYASSFAPILLEVHVDPRDVVSVPTDCGSQKIRTCRYTVIGPIEKEYAEAILPQAQQVFEDDDLDYDEDFEDEIICVEHNDVADEVNEKGVCFDCALEIAVEEVEASFEDVSKAEKVDTRYNYTRQERYPRGHAKAGQFVPKGQ